MTDADLNALRSWAEAHAPHGSTQARQVLALLAERAALRSFALAAAERCAGQSEALRNLAEKKEPKGC
ncbi:unnamed protein product [Gemmataceae bacterium]|nr:unnamed protein product [Gemmataceae bacterium]VTT96534.1 unnamed protein product [Gemmataceae bacterium]